MKQLLYRHLPPISKAIHAGRWWRSKDVLMCDVILWTISHGRASVGRPVGTSLQQFCMDSQCCL